MFPIDRHEGSDLFQLELLDLACFFLHDGLDPAYEPPHLPVFGHLLGIIMEEGVELLLRNADFIL